MDDLTVSIDSFGGVKSGEYDANGIQWTWTGTSGWFDGPPARSGFTSRPSRDGAFPSPVYNDLRVVTIDVNIAVDNPAHLQALERARTAAQAVLCNGPGQLTIGGPGPATGARVWRSDQTTCDPDGPAAYNISFQMTAVDPIRYGTSVKRYGAFSALPDNNGLDFGQTTSEAQQLLSNPDFESGVDPWTATAGYSRWLHDRTGVGGPPVHSGQRMASVVVDVFSESEGPKDVLLSSEPLNVTPGQEYSFSAWGWFRDMGPGKIHLYFYDDADNQILDAESSFDGPEEQWLGAATSATAPSGATTAQAVVWGGINKGADRFFVDDCSVTTSVQTTGGLDFGSGGLDFGTPKPLSSLYLVNEGTAPVAPVFTFDTAQSQPTLKNTSNNGRIEFLDHVTAGQPLVVDCKNKTALLNGADRLTRMRSADFDSFIVPAGGVLRVFFGSLDYPTPGAHVIATLQDGYW